MCYLLSYVYQEPCCLLPALVFACSNKAFAYLEYFSGTSVYLSVSLLLGALNCILFFILSHGISELPLQPVFFSVSSNTK